MPTDLSPIYAFKGSYQFLSNFYPCHIVFEEAEYKSVEHAYQAAKTTNKLDRLVIASAYTPGQAKQLGRALILRPGWSELRLDIMQRLLHYKFTQSPEADGLAAQLLATAPRILVEGNTWGDRFWGMTRLSETSDSWQGKNFLGLLLMKLRTQLQEQQAAQETVEDDEIPVDLWQRYLNSKGWITSND